MDKQFETSDGKLHSTIEEVATHLINEYHLFGKILTVCKYAPIQPVRDSDGSLKQSLLTVNGTRFRCACGCNVFHQPDDTDLTLYECNACEQQYGSE